MMISIPGLGDPVLSRAVWVRVFGEWLQNRRLLPSQGFGDPAVLPWNDVFDFWLQQLLKPDTQGLDTPHASLHVHDPSSTYSSGFSNPLPATSHARDVSHSHPTVSWPMTYKRNPDAQDGSGTYLTPESSTVRKRNLNAQDGSGSYLTPESSTGRKRNPGHKRSLNAVSKLTVQEIQEACRKNGAEESVIARIAVVFPIPDLVTRGHLKLAAQPGRSAGDQRDHQGYMEFAERCMVSLKNVKKRTRGTGAGQVQRYQCKLCGVAKRPRWKNSRDLLDHFWDTHCNPQDDSKPFPVPLETDFATLPPPSGPLDSFSFSSYPTSWGQSSSFRVPFLSEELGTKNAEEYTTVPRPDNLSSQRASRIIVQENA